MNGKKAKKLRRAARELTEGQPNKKYVAIPRKVRYRVPATGADVQDHATDLINKKVVLGNVYKTVEMPFRQVQLSSDSTKAAVKFLKRSSLHRQG